MRLTIYLVLVSVILATACTKLSPEPSTVRYAITPLAGGSAVMIDQASGETWRLTDSSWVPVKRLPIGTTAEDPLGIRGQSPEVVISREVDVESSRRTEIYRLLGQSDEAKGTITQYKSGASLWRAPLNANVRWQDFRRA